MTPANCASCGQRPPFRRGLCTSCYRGAARVQHWTPVAHLIENLEWMLATGETHPEMLTLRLGYTAPTSIYRALRRAGRTDLIDALRAPHN